MTRAPSPHPRAYTLVEALVASSLLAIGIAAAASMSLALVTQEEISERADRAANYLANAVALCQADCSIDLLPPEPVVKSITIADYTAASSSLDSVPATRVTMEWYSSPAKADSTLSGSGTYSWTGGRQGTVRTASVELLRRNSPSTLAAP